MPVRISGTLPRQASDRLCARLQSQGRAGSFDLVAEDEDGRCLVGWLSVEVPPFRRAGQTGHVVIGVDAAAAGRSIGRGMLAAAEQEGKGAEPAGRRNLRS